MRKIGGLLGAGLCGALAVLAVVRSPGAPPTGPVPPGSTGSTGVSGSAGPRPDRATTVDVVGDSLVTQAAGELTGQLAAADLEATVVHRPRQDLGSAFVQEQLAAVRGRPPADVLVLATAANDALRDRDRTLMAGPVAAAQAFNELFDRSLEPFGDRCVVVVNAREDTSAIYHPAHARALNVLLRGALARHPNLVLVDWAAASRGVPVDRFALDQLHFGDDPDVPSLDSGSARAYAATIIDGIRRCPP